jgi:hypothetical protein
MKAKSLPKQLDLQQKWQSFARSRLSEPAVGISHALTSTAVLGLDQCPIGILD